MVVRWKVCLPVGIDEVVAEGLKGGDFAIRPLVEIDRLDLRDVDTKSTMLAYIYTRAREESYSF